MDNVTGLEKRLQEGSEAAINIKEVAKAAGVSVATISRVLNHPEQVQPETKTHVLAVMESLNYHPNWFARGLNLGKTSTIALLVPNIESRRYREILSGVETVALKKQHIVMLCNTHADPEEEAEYLKMVVGRQVDGLILASPLLGGSQLNALLGSSLPWVHIGPAETGLCRNLCYINYEEGAYQMTTHLIKMGQKEITLLLDESPLVEMRQITAGYRRALREHLLEAKENILTCTDDPRGGYYTAQKLLQNGTLPQAMITASSGQASGVLKVLLDEAIPVPERMALACLSDSSTCSILEPPLTALEAPGKRLGMVAARMLFDNIEDSGEDGYGPQEVILQPKLKIRRSCGNTKPIYELFG